MTPREKEIRQKLKDNFEHYAKKCLKIRTKEGEVKPFEINFAQMFVHEKLEDQLRRTGKVRAIICKGRQMGCSTLIGGRYYHKVTHRFGYQAFILTHALDATQNLYKMAQRFHEHCPHLVRPEITVSNSKELIFGKLESGYKVGTAENKSVGRSSTIQLLHASEVAFWNNASEHAKGIMQAVPSAKGTEIIMESTANGIGNYFHEQWQQAEAGLSEFIPIFVPWFWSPEYSKELDEKLDITDEEAELILHHDLSYEQINWRRMKIVELSVGGTDGVKAFRQEYPCTPQEAFQSSGEDVFISPEIATAAAKMEDVEKYGPLLIGVDPARFGDDRSAIIRRQGRCIFGKQTFVKYDTMQLAGICHNILTNDPVEKMFIDTIGIGAGVYDRLVELGHGDKVVSVNVAQTPRDQKKYYNTRAELWGELREFLLDLPCSIPDDNELLSDICSVQYKFDSKGRLVIEKKEDMKKRGVRSPDTAEAVILTFYYPSSVYKLKGEVKSKKAQNIMAAFTRAQRIKDRMSIR
jgi:hypothetical protein